MNQRISYKNQKAPLLKYFKRAMFITTLQEFFQKWFEIFINNAIWKIPVIRYTHMKDLSLKEK